MSEKLDRRTAYTRMVIRESLYKLLEKKHLSEITVKELCEAADINRTTFYRNYLDIYDLYEKLEEELTETAFVMRPSSAARQSAPPAGSTGEEAGSGEP